MANKNNGDIGFFGEINQFCRGFPNLGYASCGRYNRYEGFESNLITISGSIFNLFEDVFWVLVSVRM
jgi:hypothetical protein